MFVILFSKSDKVLIEACVSEKGWSVLQLDRIIRDFPATKWFRRSVYRLIRKTKETRTTARTSGRPTTVTKQQR